MNLAKSFRSRLCQILPTLFISLLLLSCGGATAANDERLERAAQQLRNRQYEEALQSSLQAPASGRRSLMTGISLVRLNRPAEALPYLQEAERTYPLLADHAAALRAQGLFALKQYRAAAEVATKAARSSRAAALSRQMEKLAADALFEAGELTAALAAYQQFSARHSLGNDSVDARYRAALCREQLGEQAAALDEYRAVWLQHPSAPQAERAQQALKRLNQENTFRPEELYQRATLLLAAGRANDAAWALAAIPRNELSDDLLTKVKLKSGQAASKQRNYTLAKQFLARAALSRTPSIRDEARLALARVAERINESEQALARLLSLASERGPLADDALLEAGFVHKHAGRFSESNLLFERLAHDFQTSELAGRASWEAAWSHYLAGELPAAADAFQRLLNNNEYRERSLYWHARTSARQNKSQEAEISYKQLLNEFPFGFYAAWRRNQQQQATGWEPLTAGLPEPNLPAGSDRILALVGCGLMEDARTELAALKSSAPLRQQAAGFARLHLLANDPHGAIVIFHQNRPEHWERQSLPFWALGYPRPYAELFSKHAAANRLPESLVLALAKAESSFRPAVKSPVGAIGLMQLMPATARMTAGYKGSKPYNPLWLVDPEYNIRLGTKHLRELLDQFHQDTVFTLASYNAGAGAVNRWRKNFGSLERDEFIENIPYRETRDYVKKIVAHISVYQSLYRIP
ncbi:transglycosylase SLT domain-containing protein [Trichlorobacter sp.]|uniref:transglycosylase SLT domain-containing protein n=1 Tax=Trichlorobacter sp. TaxID=2911007 RepID=UPI002A361E98|nr:transglycosylase SLT domain-containing protein [Trichlorobacter sp.]MDY0383648.1 transglycosylase SLT domain-containing protein [Trichlorobacter sp.]